MNKLDKHTLGVFFIIIIGAFLAYLNVIYLFPKFLSQETIGFYRTAIAIASFLCPLAHVGLTSAIIKFYHNFIGTDKSFFAFINYTFTRSILTFILFLCVGYCVSPLVISLFQSNANLLNNHWTEIMAIVGLMIFFEGLIIIFRIKKLAWLGTIMQNIILRLLVAVLVVLYIFQNEITFFSYGLVGVYILVVVFSYFMLKKNTGYHFKFMWKIQTLHNINLWGYSAVTLIAVIAHRMTLSIDSIMVSYALGLEQNSIYTTAFFIATVIEFPKRAASMVIAPRYTNLIAKKHFRILKKLYQKTAIEQTTIAVWMLGLITLNINNIYNIMPNGSLFDDGIFVVYIIGIAKCIDLMFGHNTEVLILSNFYKHLSFLNIIILSFFIVGNYFVLERYGIQGVAWVTFFGICAFNILKSIFLWIKFKISINIKHTFIIIGIFCLSYFISDGIVNISNPYFDIFVSSSIFSFIFLFLILKSKISNIISPKTMNNLIRLS